MVPITPPKTPTRMRFCSSASCGDRVDPMITRPTRLGTVIVQKKRRIEVTP